MSGFLREVYPIAILLTVVAIVVSRLPKPDLGHDRAFLRRRFVNWFPVGLTYAFLYMGRYNLNTIIGPVLDTKQFSSIYSVGTLVYGVSFVLNGPLTDRIGGKKTIVMAAVGSLTANALMGVMVARAMVGSSVPMGARADLIPTLTLLYAINMYFQSFGAVSIVKVNSAWFHLKERGTFGGIFGILISLGLYFAYDWSPIILKQLSAPWVFYAPAIILGIFAVLDIAFVRDTPGQAGHKDFELGDATADDKLSLGKVVISMLKNPAIMTIAAIEFCSGYLRNSILQYYKPFAKQTLRAVSKEGTEWSTLHGVAAPAGDFVHDHWGMLNCMAGILGGVLAGLISDRVFGSRRGPVAGVLYAVMLIGAVLMYVTLETPWIGFVVVMMTLAIIGVHGMLSGTASMDFGGKKNVGIVVGVIDGFVYLGSSLEAVVLGHVLPKDDAAHDAHNWWTWPAVIIPAALIGLGLTTRVWHARPKSSAPAH